MEIFVSNIPLTAQPEDIRELFEPYGDVGRVNLITDRETGQATRLRVCGDAQCHEAQAAIAALQNLNVEGRQLTINEARPREPRREPRRDR